MIRRLAFAFSGFFILVVMICVSTYLAWPTILSRLDPVGHPSIPQSALQGAERRTARLLLAREIVDPKSGVPDRSVLGIIEVRRLDGVAERRVFLTRSDRPALYLGPLTRQLGTAPVDTLLFNYGAVNVIVGYVPPASLDYTSGTLVAAGGPSQELGGGGGALESMVGYPGFVVLVHTEPPTWDTLAQIELRSSFTGSSVVTVFQPPLDIRASWIRVP